MTSNQEPRLKIAPESVKRFKAKLKALFRRGRGRNLGRFIRDDLVPVLRGWINYFRLAEVKGVFEDLDQWVRHHLRCLLWRQWKRPFARARNLMRLGLDEERAWRSATNGHGPWWNSGASHFNQALPRKFFDALGLGSLLHQPQRFHDTA
jgi:RNA-directed DNA polymerase